MQLVKGKAKIQARKRLRKNLQVVLLNNQHKKVEAKQLALLTHQYKVDGEALSALFYNSKKQLDTQKCDMGLQPNGAKTYAKPIKFDKLPREAVASG